MTNSLRRSVMAIIGLSGFSIAALGNSADASEREGQDKPNVIIINVDNHSKSMLSCYGNELVETPNIDKLHKNGFSFDNYQCASRCSASRSALLSGKYHHRFGSIGTGDAREIMKSGVTTMVDYFKGSGYKTAMFGKWHNGYNYPHRPEDRGFDQVVEKGRAKDRGASGKLATVNQYRHNGTMETYEGYRTDVWFFEMNKFITENKEQPLFIYVATWATHGPNFGPPHLLKKYKEKKEEMGLTLEKDKKGNDENLLNIAAEVESIDYNLGQTRDLLKNLGLHENTIVIYMADGPGVKAPNIINASQISGSHVPLILNWPGGNLKCGLQNDDIVANIDVLPTLIELCELDELENNDLDGLSFAGFMHERYSIWKPRTYISDHQSARKSRAPGLVPLDRTKICTPKGEVSFSKGKLNSKKISPELVSYAEAEWKQWWKSVTKDYPEYNYVVVGTKHENPSFIHHSYTLTDKFAGKGEKYYFAIEFAVVGKYTISEPSKKGDGGTKAGSVTIDGKKYEGNLPMTLELAAGKHLIFVDTGRKKGCSAVKIEKI